MCSWGNRGCPSHYKGEASFFFQSVGRSGDCEVKRLFRVEYLHAEGQEVSGEHRFELFVGCGGKGKYAVQVYLQTEGQGVSGKDRFGMFAGCGGKGKYAIRNLHPPKGRRFQENIALICSERPTQAKDSRSLSLASPSAQTIFFFLFASV